MNPRLPEDIDRLLWEVAESQDPAAFDDFEKRFPQLVIELGKRIKLVRELRDARDTGDPKKPVPHFDRREPAPTIRLTPALVGMCVFALAAVGLGAYSITTHYVNNRPPEVVPLLTPALPSVPPVVIGKPSPTSPPGYIANNPTPPPSQQVPEYMKPRDFSADRLKLQVALQAVAESGGLSIEFAPNTPNPEIKLQYIGMSSLDIMKDLGVRFGFTAFDQGNHEVLIVPNRDPAANEQPAATANVVNLDAQAPPAESQPTPEKKKPRSEKPSVPS